MSHENESPYNKVENLKRYLREMFPGRAIRHSEETRSFLGAIKAGDLKTVRRMVQSNRDLLFVFDIDDYYGSPVRLATDTHPEISDYLAHVELQGLREGSIPHAHLYGVIHDLGEVAYSTIRGSDNLRAEAEPVVAGFLAHDAPEIRRIAVNVLAIHWDLKHYAQAFQRMGLTDPDEDVRQIAVAVVGWLLRGSRDIDAARFLLGIFHDPAQPAWIRDTAYEGLVRTWQGWHASLALGSRKRRREESLRAEAERGGKAGERAQTEWLSENAWEDLVDWDFVMQVEQEVKSEGQP